MLKMVKIERPCVMSIVSNGPIYSVAQGKNGSTIINYWCR